MNEPIKKCVFQRKIDQNMYGFYKKLVESRYYISCSLGRSDYWGRPIICKIEICPFFVFKAFKLSPKKG